MKDQLRKKTIIISVIIMVIVTGIIGASYAFFQANIGNTSVTNIIVSTGDIDNLVFISGEDISIKATQSNFKSGAGNLSASTSPSVKLTTGNTPSSYNYSASFIIDANSFVYTNGTTPELRLTVTKNGVTIIDNMDITAQVGTIKIPTTSGGASYDHTISTAPSSVITDTWVATVTFVNLTTNQNANVGKEMHGVFVFNKADDGYKFTTNATKLSNYKIYGNSIQAGTPTPDNPIPIQSVGEKTKNLIDYNIYFSGDSYTDDGVTYTKTDEGILVNGTSTGYANTAVKSLKEVLKPGKTYTISGGHDNVLVLLYSIRDGVTSYSSTQTITGTETALGIYLQVNPNTTVNNALIKPQLEEGGAATSYEPYGYKIPVTITGKNLISIDDQTVSYNCTAIECYDEPTYNNLLLLKTGTTYTVSFDYTVNSFYDSSRPLLCSVGYGTTHFQKDIKASSYSNITSGRYTMTFTTPDTFDSTLVPYFRIRAIRQTKGENTSIYANASISNIQLEEGSTATTYEPYFSNTTNIYLDEPLRKIGDAVDYIDYANQKVVRYTGTHTFNGSETWYTRINNDTNWLSSWMNNTQFTEITGDTINTRNIDEVLMSNYFPNDMSQKSKSYPSRTIPTILGYTDATAAFMFTSPISVGNSTTAWQSWLSAHNLELQYILASPVETSITLPNISTINGSNTITVGTTISPSKVEYS